MENQNWKQGLKEETIPVFETLSKIECIKGVDYAGRFSRHNIHSKQIYSILLNDNYFNKPEGFSLMEPKYDVSSEEIARFIRYYISDKGITIKS